MVILYIAIFLFLCYGSLMIYYWRAWTSASEFVPTTSALNTTVSVIIAARNEEQNIGALLQSLHRQTYPGDLIEVIVINDHSTDNTAAIAKAFPSVIVTDLGGDVTYAYKKSAIQQGINTATGKLIITTDADCQPKPNWIETLVSFYEKNNSRFIAAPVAYENNTSVVQLFQALDFLALQGITGASVQGNMLSMCNGANLAYERKSFFEVNGFAGIDNIASGDDMLLMHKIRRKFPAQVHYLKSKDAIVSTQPMTTWKDFLNQRIRWASKARFYDDKAIVWVLTLVYFFNLSFFALLVAASWNLKFLFWFLLLLVAKTIVEFPFVYSVARFFNKQSLIKYFFFFQPLHIGYTVVAGWLGQVVKYEWKGRRVQ